MRFEGDKLLTTLARQDVPVRVLDAAGKLERIFTNAKEALRLIAAGGYFGIGNHRRISVVQPHIGEERRAIFCGKQSDRLVLDFPVRLPTASKNIQSGLSWKPQYSRAATGVGGRQRAVFLGTQTP